MVMNNRGEVSAKPKTKRGSQKFWHFLYNFLLNLYFAVSSDRSIEWAPIIGFSWDTSKINAKTFGKPDKTTFN